MERQLTAFLLVLFVIFCSGSAGAFNQEHLDRLLETNACIFCNLENAPLGQKTLYGANLMKANLKGAYLEAANFDRANLEEADLQGANLKGATLRNANLKRANLKGASINNADFEGSNQEGMIGIGGTSAGSFITSW